MIRLILASSLLILLSGCATNSGTLQRDAHSVYALAPAADSALFEFVAGDERTLRELEAPVSALRVLYMQLESWGAEKSLVEFIEVNPQHSFTLYENWSRITQIVSDHAVRNDAAIPDELKQFAFRAGTTYEAVSLMVRKRDRTETLQRYMGVILQIIAARNGVAF